MLTVTVRPVCSQPVDRAAGQRPTAGHSQTTTYISAVAYCCLVVVVWQRIWLISMLPVVVVYYFFKRLGQSADRVLTMSGAASRDRANRNF